MSKRFTDTNKWDHAWFRKLQPAMKCAWTYICDKCDHAGMWTVDFEAMSFNIGEEISKEQFVHTFKEKVFFLKEDKILIQSFIDFQYGALNPDNRVHLSVISLLEKEGANKALRSSLKGAKDKDKDKDKVKDKDILGIDEKTFLDLYALYPRKIGKNEGLKKLRTIIKSTEDVERFRSAIGRYIEHCVAERIQPGYIKHFSTFVNHWTDWLEPDAGGTSLPDPMEQANSDIRQLFEERDRRDRA